MALNCSDAVSDTTCFILATCSLPCGSSELPPPVGFRLSFTLQEHDHAVQRTGGPQADAGPRSWGTLGSVAGSHQSLLSQHRKSGPFHFRRSQSQRPCVSPSQGKNPSIVLAADLSQWLSVLWAHGAHCSVLSPTFSAPSPSSTVCGRKLGLESRTSTGSPQTHCLGSRLVLKDDG